jgi:hypothetical protein
MFNSVYEKGANMFKIGNKVSWQCRNKNDTSRFSNSFYTYSGVITAVSDKTITAEYKYSGRNETGYCTRIGTQDFRQLRNGRWIPKHEKKDDPKGRLYLNITYDEMETA